RYALCATTGRAAKQLAASTGRLAATVHRHLRIGGSNAPAQPVQEPVLVIDESSMIDLWLLEQIVARLRPHTQVLLVGDVDQLPAVGPGAVLQDLIAAGEQAHLPGVQVTRLSRIFRQEAGNRSLIVANCHRVRAGERPLQGAPKDSDYYEMYRETPEQARDLAVALATERLPRYLDVPPTEVQVLAPMHTGVAGIRALNRALQEALNPPQPGRVELALHNAAHGGEGGYVLRVGDKVRQTRNDYQKEVFNGDLGVVAAMDPETRSVTVAYDEHSATYAFDELDEIVHAWAMTVHSAQGSQWPAVVIVMLTNHYVMLERNILYTALSRAQRLAVLITQEQAVRIAVGQARSTQRRTRLVARLTAALAEGAQSALLGGPRRGPRRA
ncbi:MAG: AAA family ATPase, partial [Chloroflexota bacterium]